MRNGVFADSNFLLHHLAGNPEAKKIVDFMEEGLHEGFINQIVVSEVIFVYAKLATKSNAYQLKKNP